MTSQAWATLASVATALGTLVLAIATFSAIKSANQSARVAERALLAGLRPVLMPTRREDSTQKVNFGDNKWMELPGGSAAAEIGYDDPDNPKSGTEGVVYLGFPLRNAGSGIAVLHGWIFYPDWHRDVQHAPLEDFQRQNRDLYIPVGDVGFWQGAYRDTAQPGYEEARKVIEAREPWTVELLYGDHEGGQRVISRFTMLPIRDQHAGSPASPSVSPSGSSSASPDLSPGRTPELGWLATASRHWNIDRPDPR